MDLQKKKYLDSAQDPSIPEGHVVMPSYDRMNTLQVLQRGMFLFNIMVHTCAKNIVTEIGAKGIYSTIFSWFEAWVNSHHDVIKVRCYYFVTL